MTNPAPFGKGKFYQVSGVYYEIIINQMIFVDDSKKLYLEKNDK